MSRLTPPCLVIVAATLGAGAVNAVCEIPEVEEGVAVLPPRLALQSGEGFAQTLGLTTPGGICTVQIDETFTENADGCAALRWLRMDVSGSNAEEVELELVRAGEQLGLFRIPEDATPDEHFAPFKDCGDSGRFFGVGCDVTATGVVERDAPVVVSDDTRVRPPEPFDAASVCDDTPGDLLPHVATGYSETIIDMTVETEAKLLLLDVWLMARDEALPAESEARFIESRLIDAEEMFPNQEEPSTGVVFGDVDADVLRFALHQPGAYDMHVRFTDPATGLSSDDYVIAVDTPAPEFQGCYCGAGSRADAAVAVSFLAMLAVMKRRRLR